MGGKNGVTGGEQKTRVQCSPPLFKHATENIKGQRHNEAGVTKHKPTLSQASFI